MIINSLSLSSSTLYALSCNAVILKTNIKAQSDKIIKINEVNYQEFKIFFIPFVIPLTESQGLTAENTEKYVMKNVKCL